jgi:hypothetical protein
LPLSLYALLISACIKIFALLKLLPNVPQKFQLNSISIVSYRNHRSRIKWIHSVFWLAQNPKHMKVWRWNFQRIFLLYGRQPAIRMQVVKLAYQYYLRNCFVCEIQTHNAYCGGCWTNQKTISAL